MPYRAFSNLKINKGQIQSHYVNHIIVEEFNE